jgi:hypothetical protein
MRLACRLMWLRSIWRLWIGCCLDSDTPETSSKGLSRTYGPGAQVLGAFFFFTEAHVVTPFSAKIFPASIMDFMRASILARGAELRFGISAIFRLLIWLLTI